MNAETTSATFRDVPVYTSPSSGLVGRGTRRSLVRLAAAITLVVCMTLASTGTASAWLHLGREVRYPSSGGTWEYGFWDAKVRSYYTVNRCHGSSVIYNGTLNRSINTAAGQKSIAELWAYNSPGATDEYYYRTC